MSDDIQNPDNEITEHRRTLPVVPCWMTKREYFAALAMQGLLSAPTDTLRLPSNVCSSALLFADELIDQLEK